MAATREQTGIDQIDGLFSPYSLVDCGNGPNQVVYWGVGYKTEAEARACLRAFEAGRDNLPGIPVDHNTGFRRGI